MAWDDSETEYHLTSRGWETGDPPMDSVETWVRHVYQASSYSSEQVSWRCEWADPNVTRDVRDELRTKHSAFMGTPGRSAGRETTIGEPR